MTAPVAKDHVDFLCGQIWTLLSIREVALKPDASEGLRRWARTFSRSFTELEVILCELEMEERDTRVSRRDAVHIGKILTTVYTGLSAFEGIQKT